MGVIRTCFYYYHPITLPEYLYSIPFLVLPITTFFDTFLNSYTNAIDRIIILFKWLMRYNFLINRIFFKIYIKIS